MDALEETPGAVSLVEGARQAVLAAPGDDPALAAAAERLAEAAVVLTDIAADLARYTADLDTDAASDLDALIARGLAQAEPIVYEDFLPVSAAGIFQSNLGGEEQKQYAAHAAQQAFEAGDYTGALKALAVLKAPVDAFFDGVMVNAEDAALKANRLGLLATLHGAMNRVADLSRLAA